MASEVDSCIVYQEKETGNSRSLSFRCCAS